jgi:hypothetical protein
MPATADAPMRPATRTWVKRFMANSPRLLAGDGRHDLRS